MDLKQEDKDKHWFACSTDRKKVTALQLISAAKNRTLPNDVIWLLDADESAKLEKHFTRKETSADRLKTLYQTLNKREFPNLRQCIRCTPGVCSGDPTIGFRLRVTGFLWMFGCSMADGSDTNDPWLAPLILAYTCFHVISDEPLRAALLYAFEHPGFDKDELY